MFTAHFKLSDPFMVALLTTEKLSCRANFENLNIPFFSSSLKTTTCPTFFILIFAIFVTSLRTISVCTVAKDKIFIRDTTTGCRRGFVKMY